MDGNPSTAAAFLRFLIVLGPFFLGVFILWRVMPKLVGLQFDPEEKRAGKFNDYLAQSVIAALIIIASVLGFFLYKPVVVGQGTIDWGKNTGTLISRDGRVHLARREAKPGHVIYEFRASSKKGIEDGDEFKLVQERPAAFSKGGAVGFGKDSIDSVGGEEFVKGGEGILTDEITLTWTSGCPGKYFLDMRLDAIKEKGMVIRCRPEEKPAKKEEAKTSFLDLLIPKAHARVLSLLPSALFRQSRAGRFQKLVGDVTLWDVEVLASEHSDAGSKVLALRRMSNLIKDKAEELGVASIKKAHTTLPLDLLDLTRHNDPEVAGLAGKLIEAMDVGHAVEETFAMWHHPPDKVLAKITVLPPKWRKRVMTNAADTLKEVGFSKQERKLRTELKKVEDVPQQKLIPTGTPAGDRYYVKLNWDKTDAKTGDCLARLLQKEMNLWSLDQEKKFAATKSHRVVYWYSRTKALNVALGAGKCGAKARDISGLPASK